MSINLTKDELNLLINFFQNASISNINGNAMIALVQIMNKIAALLKSIEDPNQGE